MTTAEIAWRKFTETFGEAIALHWKQATAIPIVKLIRRSRELLDDYYDELPRGRTPAEQVFRERWRRSLISSSRWRSSSASRDTETSRPE